jgi:hypothetical protein
MLTFYPSRIPDPGVKKAHDPGSKSATLFLSVSPEGVDGEGDGHERPKDGDDGQGVGHPNAAHRVVLGQPGGGVPPLHHH